MAILLTFRLWRSSPDLKNFICIPLTSQMKKSRDFEWRCRTAPSIANHPHCWNDLYLLTKLKKPNYGSLSKKRDQYGVTVHLLDLFNTVESRESDERGGDGGAGGPGGGGDEARCEADPVRRRRAL